LATEEPAPAVDWTLPRRSSAGGVDGWTLGYSPPRSRSAPPRRQEAAKFTHPAHCVASILPQIRQFSVRKAEGLRARFRLASPIHPPQVCPLAPISGARLAGWSRQEPAAVGTFVPSWFVFMRIGLMGMGEGRVGIRSVWVPGS